MVDLSISTNYVEEYKKIKDSFRLIEEGIITGYTTGFEALDKHVGRVQKGQMWTVGGYNATGKSFFVLHMVDEILREYSENNKDVPMPRISVFSTDLDNQTYISRHIFKRAGIWELSYKNDPNDWSKQVHEVLEDYYSERIANTDSLNIYGSISSYEEIEKIVSAPGQTPDIIFIDHIQDLSVTVGDRVLSKEEDCMAIIPTKLLQLALKYNIAVVVISQVNNYSLSTESKSSRLAPFSNGKTLNNKSHCQILIERERIDGVLSKVLDLVVIKNRSGGYTTLATEIHNGFQISQISGEKAKRIKDQEQNNELY